MSGDATSYEEAKVPVEEFVLPRGYVFKGKDKSILLNRATFREITGEEEDIITNDKLSFTWKMVKVVASCMEKLEDAEGNAMTDKKQLEKAARMLTIGDLTAAIFAIRIVSTGEEITQRVECPNEACDTGMGKSFSWTARFNLRKDFPIEPCKDDPMQVVREFTTKRGHKVTWQMMTGDARIKYESTATSKNRATAALMMRVLTVNDEPASEEVLRKLPLAVRQEMRDHMLDQEGGIETTFEAECSNCGHEFKESLDIQGFSFFIPSETLDD